MTTKNIKLNSYARESAEIYAQALIDACRKAKVANPILTLTDADDYPRLLKIPTIEYAIGWLNGCAEAHGVTVEVLWTQLAPATPRKARAA